MNQIAYFLVLLLAASSASATTRVGEGFDLQGSTQHSRDALGGDQSLQVDHQLTLQDQRSSGLYAPLNLFGAGLDKALKSDFGNEQSSVADATGGGDSLKVTLNLSACFLSAGGSSYRSSLAISNSEGLIEHSPARLSVDAVSSLVGGLVANANSGNGKPVAVAPLGADATVTPLKASLPITLLGLICLALTVASGNASKSGASSSRRRRRKSRRRRRSGRSPSGRVLRFSRQGYLYSLRARYLRSTRSVRLRCAR